jgi:hypothetical protein
MKGPEKTRAIGATRRWQLLLALLLWGIAAAAPAAVLDGVFEVRSAYITVDDGVFLLNARTEYPVNEEIRSALTDGVTLYFDLEALVERGRRLWLDASVVETFVRRELSWHAVRERYVVRDIGRGELEYYATLEQALQAIGIVSSFPVITEPQLEPDASYDISVRASMRRGSMPDAVRALIWWSDSWHRRTDWVTWSLPR